MKFFSSTSFCALLVFKVQAGEEEFNELQYKLEADVLELRQAVEDAYENRCDPSTFDKCSRGNYDSCVSSFPDPVCPAGEDFALDVCADDCSTTRDYSTSVVSFPPFPGSRDDSDVVGDICFSKSLDSYFIQKYEVDKAYWANYGIDNPSMHVGMPSGAFRIYPARFNETCNAYDPRVRPWYVAGSSGPKNVVMILDVSGSMDGIRLHFLKQAATRIIDTLTVGDRIALVPFSTKAQAEYFNGQALVKVTASIKKELKARVDDLQAAGSTNIFDAFSRAFQVMEDSIPLELVVDCNTALLFLTDGKMTDPADMTEQRVLDFVEEGLNRLTERLSHPVYLFSYSISENDDVHSFPKQLACTATTNGVWSKIIDDRTIVESLSSYTHLFSLGLGEGRNDDFVAWVEPYEFSTVAEMGVTVSSPAFDRSVDPPVLIAVVGLDLMVKALDRALEVETGSSETYDRIVLSSTARCPRLEISACHLEAFRSFGIDGDEARCGMTDNCTATDDMYFYGESCANQNDLPSDVLANRDNIELHLVAKTCCTPTEESATSSPFVSKKVDSCIAASLKKQFDDDSGSDSNKAAIIGGSVGGAVFLLWCCGFCASKQHGNKPATAGATPDNVDVENLESVALDKIRVENLEVVEAPLPFNPQASAPPGTKES